MKCPHCALAHPIVDRVQLYFQRAHAVSRSATSPLTEVHRTPIAAEAPNSQAITDYSGHAQRHCLQTRAAEPANDLPDRRTTRVNRNGTAERLETGKWRNANRMRPLKYSCTRSTIGWASAQCGHS